MFEECSNLKNIHIEGFEIINATNMSYMLAKCSSITSINNYSYRENTFYLSNIFTENVINMSNMFEDCTNLKYINISSFNTKNFKIMSHVFTHCCKLEEII